MMTAAAAIKMCSVWTSELVGISDDEVGVDDDCGVAVDGEVDIDGGVGDGDDCTAQTLDDVITDRVKTV